MNHKALGILLILFSGIGYLEWGGNQRTFLFQAEFEIIPKLFTNPISVLHPFIILPFIGQFLILFAIIKSPFNPKILYIGIGLLSILLGFMFIIGCISLNPKIIFSTLPFLGLSGFVIWEYKTLI
jgi:hypothetical protein